MQMLKFAQLIKIVGKVMKIRMINRQGHRAPFHNPDSYTYRHILRLDSYCEYLKPYCFPDAESPGHPG